MERPSPGGLPFSIIRKGQNISQNHHCENNSFSMLSQNEYELTTAERVSAFFHLNDLLYMAGGTAFVFLCALVVEELPLAWNVADDIFQSGGI